MRKLQESFAAKLLVWLLLLGMAFAAGNLGVRAIWAVPYLEASTWQDLAPFYNRVSQREEQLALLFAASAAMEDQTISYLDRQELQQNLNRVTAAMERENTLFRYQVRDQNSNQIIAHNLAAGETLAALVPQIHYAAFVQGEYTVYRSGSTHEPTIASAAPTFVIECGVLPTLDAAGQRDEFWALEQDYGLANQNFYWWMGSAVGALALAFLCLLFLLWSCGHRRGTPGICQSWQEKIFLDLYACGVAVAGYLCFLLLGSFWYGVWYETDGFLSEMARLAVSADAAVVAGLTTLLLRTFAVRCKAKSLCRTTLTCRAWAWICRGWIWAWHWGVAAVQAIPLIWRTIAWFMGYLLLCFLSRSLWRYNPIPLFLVNAVVLLYLCHWTVCFQRLRKGSDAIARGNLNHQIDTTKMPQDLRCHAFALNNISEGLTGAVEEKMKSERFKAELITNVSHDLKTPLTSIINYVNLLKLEEISNPKAQEYIEVLDRKSQRLKKLTEDLVEASKASTGAMTVNREKLGMSQLVDQALGEYAEKLESRNLVVIKSLPEGETYVYADGRHLWRVIDNLLGNCAKYAMEGTRIYLELTRGKGQVTLAVKNISREPLNVSPDRLLERFVRGDESRTTEGSGLGLSIARSLTELQGGTFELAVDGDLFKAVVTLPQSG